MNTTKFMVLMVIAFAISTAGFAQAIPADNTALATKELTDLKAGLQKKNVEAKGNDVSVLQRMLEVGMWTEAYKSITAKKNNSPEYQLLLADYFVLNNDFKEAEKIVNKVLQQNAGNQKALLTKAFLEIQAWHLAEAAAICEKSNKKIPSEKMELMLGRARLLQKDYTSALKIAKKILSANPKSAGAYLLEADVYFWNQQPDKAEAPLKKSLEIDPFNADARFSYGYAIWRRIDATQLNAMAAQWELALALNPLHFQTHWHWGNGHTNLTYADYAEKNDDEVRNELTKADDEIRKNNVAEAITITRQVEEKYPTSILPLLHRGSIYYMAFDMDRKTRLDSAEDIFKKILQRKKHYGPAHNGLAAVIKSKRIPYLASFDSISNVLNHTQITDSINFERVFSDVAYYPGQTVNAMVWNQMYAAVVYFPFLSKQNRSFHIPPLHIDLATAMNSSYFRFGTTFDNRQWMDIRGVGSGAAGIGYVERGAYGERNVVLHEYVHLFHGSVLTDAENRQIRALYYNAMKEKRTLDYYSQNNEHEYFAQTYPAYFEPVKVHPLDFKSMNTTAALKAKDPAMYHFIDQLVKKQRAYLAGDKKAMASNWAEVYLNLSQGRGRGARDYKKSAAYLDTALSFDNKYLPAFIGYANLKKEQKNFKEADEWLQKAEKIDASYAPIYVAWSDLALAKLQAGVMERSTSFSEQIKYLKKAASLEKDFQESARVAMLLRECYKDNGMIAEAIKAADDYAKNGATVSTYLRDRIDDAIAFSAVLKSSLGYSEPVTLLENLVAQNPQNFEFRNLYADALAINNQYHKAISTLAEAQRILSASGNARPDYNMRIAEFYNRLGNKDSAQYFLQPFLEKKSRISNTDSLRFLRLLSETSHPDMAWDDFKKLSAKGDPFYMADYFFTEGLLFQLSGKVAESNQSFEKAIELNPYLLEAASGLIKNYKGMNEGNKTDDLKKKLNSLQVKPDAKYLEILFSK